MNNNDLGTQLVNILYSNTSLNYDSCALNLIKVLQDSIQDSESNPDFHNLNKYFQFFDDLNDQLQSGETNFYECKNKILKYLKCAKKIIKNQSDPSIFSNYLASKRHSFTNIYEVWRLSTDSLIKNYIIEFIYTCFHSDVFLVEYLYRNTNLVSELFFALTEKNKIRDFPSIVRILICLSYFLCNITSDLSNQVTENIKRSQILESLFDLLESNEEFIYQKISSINTDSDLFKLSLNTLEENDEIYLIDLIIIFTLSLNSKFSLPEQNVLVKFLLKNEENDMIRDYKILSEKMVYFLNLDDDPIVKYKVILTKINSEVNKETFYVNSVLKFMSDIFSDVKTKESTGIFYQNDFRILIEIIIRKLSNLSANDQVRSDYLSLIQLVIKNSNYVENLYRIDDLLECFNSILNEKDQYTIDQDIVRVILTETPELLKN
ncbi:unnamed protein product [Brachionus calyciflorus]|uniref:SPIN90/Ldb17 leucine-rich domain-containing protein n=1 Tax=Brachionus calyciflorus TaxID=104777 RepID=A0A813M3D2_9BILA|nr:unnamed protein product [Brachionus calyciflorus]